MISLQIITSLLNIHHIWDKKQQETAGNMQDVAGRVQYFAGHFQDCAGRFQDFAGHFQGMSMHKKEAGKAMQSHKLCRAFSELCRALLNCSLCKAAAELTLHGIFRSLQGAAELSLYKAAAELTLHGIFRTLQGAAELCPLQSCCC